MGINTISVLLAVKPFVSHLNSLYYRRHVSPEQIRQVLQAHSEGSSLRGISRTSSLAYNTVVSNVRSDSQKAQLVHNQEVQAVETDEVCADEIVNASCKW